MQLEKLLFLCSKQHKGMDIIVIGGGTLFEFVVDICDRNKKHHVVGIYDDSFPERKSIHNIPVLGCISDAKTSTCKNVVICVGKPSFRAKTYQALKTHHFNFPNIIDDSVIISKTAILEDGIIIGPFSSILTQSSISKGSCMLSHVNINQDVTIDSFCLIGAACVLGNKVHLNEGVHISMGKHIAPESNVPAWTYIQ